MLSLSRCFTTLPMSDSFKKRNQDVLWEWVSAEPLIETFPVERPAGQVQKAGGATSLRWNPKENGKYTGRMLRNYANIEITMGKPLREKYSAARGFEITPKYYHEEGTGDGITDIAGFTTRFDYKGSVRTQPQAPFITGDASEKITLSGSIFFIPISVSGLQTTEGDALIVRDLKTDKPLCFNFPGLPFLPPQAVRTGDQWKLSGYSGQRSRFFAAGAPSQSTTAVTLIFMVYRFSGFVACATGSCAFVEFSGDSYEIREFGGKNSFDEIKKAAQNLSEADEKKRAENDWPGFAATTSHVGYFLLDTRTQQLVAVKVGKEGLISGGSRFGPVSGSGQGVYREQWVIEKKQD